MTDKLAFIHILGNLSFSLRPNAQTGWMRMSKQKSELTEFLNSRHCCCTDHIPFHLKTWTCGWQVVTEAAESFWHLSATFPPHLLSPFFDKNMKKWCITINYVNIWMLVACHWQLSFRFTVFQRLALRDIKRRECYVLPISLWMKAEEHSRSLSLLQRSAPFSHL